MTSRVIAPFSSSSISSNKNNNDNSNPALAPKTQQDTFSPSNEKFESVSEINVTSFSQIMGDAANGDAANLAIKTSEMDVSSSSSRVYKSPVCPDPDKCTPTSDVRHLVQKESVHNGSVITRGRAFSDATAAFDIATESPLKGIKSYPTTFSSLGKLLEANKSWASATAKKNPTFFKKLADQQTPQLLWIGCSDSRVPANQIVNLAPGEVFVHRNIANVVVHTDINCLSVIQYAVDVLQVKHIIVCGHYGCGGVIAAMRNKQFGLIDNWLRNIKDVCKKHIDKLDAIEDPTKKADLLCELNVANSVGHVCATTIVQNAWARGQELSVHGWCYRIDDGIIRDLNLCISGMDAMEKIYWMN